MGGGHERAHLLGDPFQAKAVLERQPDLGEAGTAKRRLESVGELRERPNLGAVVDKDDAAGRIGHGVDAGEAGHHRVPDYDRPLDAQPDEQLVDLTATSSSGAGPRLSPCAGRSIAMLRTEPRRRSTMGRQVRRSKVKPCRKTTGTPVPSASYASLEVWCGAVAIGLPQLVDRICNTVT